ncbi:MAG: hypothetical protein ACR65X_14480, partial [Methylocystis sp.]
WRRERAVRASSQSGAKIDRAWDAPLRHEFFDALDHEIDERSPSPTKHLADAGDDHALDLRQGQSRRGDGQQFEGG